MIPYLIEIVKLYQEKSFRGNAMTIERDSSKKLMIVNMLRLLLKCFTRIMTKFDSSFLKIWLNILQMIHSLNAVIIHIFSYLTNYFKK